MSRTTGRYDRRRLGRRVPSPVPGTLSKRRGDIIDSRHENWRRWFQSPNHLVRSTAHWPTPPCSSLELFHGLFQTSLTAYLCYLCSAFTAHALSHCPFTAHPLLRTSYSRPIPYLLLASPHCPLHHCWLVSTHCSSHAHTHTHTHTHTAHRCLSDPHYSPTSHWEEKRGSNQRL
jgi:hypothetical protein